MNRVSVLALFTVFAVMPAGLACNPAKKRSPNPFAAPGTARWMPARWQPNQSKSGDVRVVRVRVYGGHEHRTQSMTWNRQFLDQVDLANQLLVPEFGARLEVVEFQPWTRQAPNDDMAAMLEELEARDSGADVELVVGLVSALSSTTPLMHDLGMARPLGRHILLRGYSDLAERRAFEEHKPKEEVFQVRKQHKQAAVLLHEFGHSVGAMHVRQPESALMHPSYDTKMAAFAKDNARIMESVLAARLQDPKAPSLVRELDALAQWLPESQPWDGWNKDDYQATRRWLAEARAAQTGVADTAASSNTAAGSSAGSAAGSSADSAAGSSADKPSIPPEARDIFNRVQGFARSGQLDAAWSELQNLMQAYPANAEFRLFACQLWLRREGPKQTATEQCTRAGELDPDNPTGGLALARALAQAGQPDQANQPDQAAQLAQAAQVHAVLQTVLERAATSKGDRQRTFDAALAIYQAMSAVTWTERAVAKAPPDVDTKAARSWTVTTRRRYGLPPDGARHGISEAREGEYITRVHEVLGLTYAKKYVQARKLARQGLRAFKNAPGFSGALCDLEYRAQAYAVAYSHCAAALRFYGDASWSRYLMGILELRKKHNRAGIGHLEKAIANDPDLKQAYHALYQAYARIKDRGAQSTLRATYYERFGTPLPTR